MESKNMGTPDLKQIQYALYTINRHAKTALNPSELYHLKKTTLKRLLAEKRAEKVNLQYSINPRNGLQSSVVLVKVGTTDNELKFYFHMLAEKGDFDLNLKHIGKIDNNINNPKVHMGLETAKSILYRYIKEKPLGSTKKHTRAKVKHLDNVFVSSYLDGRKRY
ncbi:YkyB family protein [Evansella sp. AB-rgal1]|uniref:YkyB family protein n=1 Tax=Evansella sp. AB-rgal1 TaxID=3242696 RepID=UPI00359E2221